MTATDVFAFIIAIVIILSGLLGVFFLLNNSSELYICNKIQKRINTALISIFTDYSNDEDYDKALYSLELIFQKELPRSSILAKKYESVLDLLEFFVVDIHGGKIHFADESNTCKQAVFPFLDIYKRKYPLKQLTGPSAVVLQELLICSDSERQLELVNQLAIELKKKEETLQNLHTRKHTSDIIAIVGIISTIISICLGIYQMFT